MDTLPESSVPAVSQLGVQLLGALFGGLWLGPARTAKILAAVSVSGHADQAADKETSGMARPGASGFKKGAMGLPCVPEEEEEGAGGNEKGTESRQVPGQDKDMRPSSGENGEEDSGTEDEVQNAATADLQARTKPAET